MRFGSNWPDPTDFTTQGRIIRRVSNPIQPRGGDVRVAPSHHARPLQELSVGRAPVQEGSTRRLPWIYSARGQDGQESSAFCDTACHRAMLLSRLGEW